MKRKIINFIIAITQVIAGILILLNYFGYYSNNYVTAASFLVLALGMTYLFILSQKKKKTI